MKNIFRIILFFNFFTTSFALAASGSKWGINAAIGVPFLSSGGVNYSFSDKIGLDLDYGLLDVSAGTAKAKLSMPSLMLRWHPFAGSFFIGAGVGQESLSVTATSGSSTAKIDVTATTAVAKTGWMWGVADGGFWFGVDMEYVSPSGAKTTITSALPTTDPTYQDALTQSNKFGNTPYTNITFARFGYMF